MCLLFLEILLFLFFLSIPDTTLRLLCISFFAATNILEDPKAVISIAIPTAFTSATHVAPTPMGSGNFPSLVPSLIFIIGLIPLLRLFLVNLYSISYFFPGPTPVEVTPSSWFEVGNSSATVLDPASEAAAFFIRFDQPEANDLDPAGF